MVRRPYLVGAARPSGNQRRVSSHRGADPAEGRHGDARLRRRAVAARLPVPGGRRRPHRAADRRQGAEPGRRGRGAARGVLGHRAASHLAGAAVLGLDDHATAPLRRRHAVRAAPAACRTRPPGVVHRGRHGVRGELRRPATGLTLADTPFVRRGEWINEPRPPSGGCMGFDRLLARIVDACRRHAILVALAGVLIAALSAFYAAGHLGLVTNTDKLFASSQPWRQRADEMNRRFPQFRDLLVIVVDGDSPEAADDTAAALDAALAADTAHFATVRRPDALPFFKQNGLLFLDQSTLEGVLNQTIDAQPFLGQLVADPSARGLFAALSLVGLGVEQGNVDLGPDLASLRSFHQSMADALAGHPHPLSWSRLLAGNTADLGGKYRFVLAQPHLDFGALEPGGSATAAARAAAAKLPLVQDGEARVRITGPVALADEEFATVAQGALAGTLGSL